MSTAHTATDSTPRAALVSIHFGADIAMYLGILLCLLASKFLGEGSGVNGDTVAYLDISDAVRHHLWPYIFNASWFPLYPAALAMARAAFHFRVRYDLLAARLLEFILGIGFLASSVAMAASVRRLMLVRGFSSIALVPTRTLCAWVTGFAFIVLSSDLVAAKPDTLLSVLILLSVSSFVVGFERNSLTAFLMYGLFAGCAFWTKAFALPFFCMLTLFVALANLRNFRVLSRLALACVVFILIAGPYIWKISEIKGRFTIGDAGNLNSAWYVNGADRFNPVSDLTVYHMRQAGGNLKHPAELLARRPEITYYEKGRVYGCMPEWDDFSYWSDGLRPRFHFAQSLSTVVLNLSQIAQLVAMRLDALFLILALGCWGFYVTKKSFAHPALISILAASFLSFVLYVLIHIEGRYVAFAVVIIGILLAACCSSKSIAYSSYRSLHLSVLLIVGVILAFTFQRTMHEWKANQSGGDRAFHGLYDYPVFSAGADLGSLYPSGTEVACFGHDACLGDALWARFANVRIAAVIDETRGEISIPIEQSCAEFNQNPLALDTLRQRNIKVIVGRFEQKVPCSASWRPLGKSHEFYYLPLQES